MKFIFVTDLHGSIPRYEKVLEEARTLGVQAVVNGGDMLPKDLWNQGRFITDYLDDYFFRYNSFGIYHLGFLGNDDLGIFDELFDKTCKKYSLVSNLAQNKIKVENQEFIGMNWINDCPFRLKDRCRIDTLDHVLGKQFGTALLSTPGGWREVEDWPTYVEALPTVADELDRLPMPDNMSQSIYVIHAPPHRLRLDHCFGGIRAGSKAVYQFLKKHQPLLSLHGHIHESPNVSGFWQAKLSRTVCIQPGQLEKSELTYVLIDTSPLSYQRFKKQIF